MTTHTMSDRDGIIDLVNRYFAAVDDKHLDTHVVTRTFADDGRIVRPDGSELAGPQTILAGQTESFARFRVTHHVITDHVLDLDQDNASLRANITAMHLWDPAHLDPASLESYFLAGGVLRALAVRTADGWRLNEFRNHVAWRTGAGFHAMLQTSQLRPA